MRKPAPAIELAPGEEIIEGRNVVDVVRRYPNIRQIRPAGPGRFRCLMHLPTETRTETKRPTQAESLQTLRTGIIASEIAREMWEAAIEIPFKITDYLQIIRTE